uniref:Sec7-domain-containing protein n=1 Tax=Trepomonas sp. PC1 TaxID=1076344 RepID=A0A146KE86_9EUKA|eukprot:JAP94518.1 Sec7-domain-containing protein [Trepomonas sp. PC1]
MGKVVDICVKYLKSLLQDSRMLSEILPPEVDQAYVQERNLASIIIKNVFAMKEQYPKQLQMVIEALKALLLYNNDVHYDQHDELMYFIMKLVVQFPGNKEIKQLNLLYIQVLSQKLQYHYSKKKDAPIPHPTGYDAYALEKAYLSEYRSFLQYLQTQIKNLNSVSQYFPGPDTISIESFANQTLLKLEVLPANLDKYLQVYVEQIFWMVRLLPVSLLQDQYFIKLYEQIYNELLKAAINSQQLAKQEQILVTVELLFKTFLNTFNNQVIFEHFNSFILRIIKTKEIQYNQLKMSMLAHLSRLVCCDFGNYGIDEDIEQIPYRIVEYASLLNCDEVDQTHYFQLLQRKMMPPGQLLQLLFANYDAQFTQPNLVKSIFATLTQQIEREKDQLPNPKEQIEPIILNKVYNQAFIFGVNAILKVTPQKSEFGVQMQQFVKACGFYKMTDEYLNSSIDDYDNKSNRYKITSFQQGLVTVLARIVQEFAQSYQRFQYNEQKIKFTFDFGFNTPANITNESIEAIIDRKTTMEIGYEKFDENPLKAMIYLRDQGFTQKLEPAKPNTRIKIDYELQEALHKWQQYSMKDEEEEGQEKKRKRKRNFEEEYCFNLAQIAKHIGQFSNADEVYQQTIQTVLEYQKKSDYSVGLSKAGLGELMGGNKVENRCCLYYFIKHFKKTMFSQKDVKFVGAIRSFLSFFKLPGEGQVIDRILSFFSKSFADYSHMDHRTVHGLAFAVIMLNTDLHNESMKDRRMTKETFIKNTKQIDYANQITDQMLIEIYDEILVNPFTLGSIEEIKKFFNILAKYVNVDEKKEEKKEEDKKENTEQDKELEMLRQIPKPYRYAKAFSEWIEYSMTYTNPNLQDSTLDSQPIIYTSSYKMFNKMVMNMLSKDEEQEKDKQLTPILAVLDYIRNPKYSYGERPNYQLMASKQILLMLGSQLLNIPNDILLKFIAKYIEASDILVVPILQQVGQDSSQYSEQVINLNSIKNLKIKEQNNIIINEYQVELVSYLLQYVRQMISQDDNYNKCYSGKLKLQQNWTQVIQVISKVQYFNMLANKHISNTHRKLAKTNTPSEFQKLLALDIQTFFVNYIISQQMLQNLQTIVPQLQMFGFQLVDFFQNNIETIEKQELVSVTVALSTVVNMEQATYLISSYNLFSQKNLNSLLQNLVKCDVQLFESIFIEIANYYESIFCSRIKDASLIGFDSIEQVISSYLSDKLNKKLRTNQQILENLESEEQIWKQILNPMNFSLNNHDLIYKVIDKFFNGYIEFMDLEKSQRIKFMQYLQAPSALTYTDIQEFVQIYSHQFQKMVFPKTTLLTFLSITKQCVDKLNEMGIKQFSKDNTLSLQAKQQQIRPAIQKAMHNVVVKLDRLQEICESLWFTKVDENELIVSDNNRMVQTQLIALIQQVFGQTAVSNVTEKAVDVFFSYGYNMIRLILQTQPIMSQEQSHLNGINNFFNQFFNCLVFMLGDARTNIREAVIEKFQELIRKLLEGNYSRDLLQKGLQILINRVINLYLETPGFEQVFCNNLDEDKFVCGCHKYNNHCYVEYIIDLFITNDDIDTLKTDIGEYIMSQCLKHIVQKHYPSLINILRYLMRNMASKHAEFIYKLFSSIEVKNVNIIDTVPLLQNFLGLVFNNEDVITKTFTFACNLKLTSPQTLVEFDSLLCRLLELYGQLEGKVKVNCVEPLKNITKHYFQLVKDKVPFVIKIIQFYQDEQMYEKYFKVDMFNEVVKLIKFENIDVRTQVAELFMAKYKPE